MPLDCQWSSWSGWTQCSKTCGNGQKFKTRSVFRNAVNGGKDWAGDDRITQECQTRQCQGKLKKSTKDKLDST